MPGFTGSIPEGQRVSLCTYAAWSEAWGSVKQRLRGRRPDGAPTAPPTEPVGCNRASPTSLFLPSAQAIISRCVERRFLKLHANRAKLCSECKLGSRSSSQPPGSFPLKPRFLFLTAEHITKCKLSLLCPACRGGKRRWPTTAFVDLLLSSRAISEPSALSKDPSLPGPRRRKERRPPVSEESEAWHQADIQSDIQLPLGSSSSGPFVSHSSGQPTITGSDPCVPPPFPVLFILLFTVIRSVF